MDPSVVSTSAPFGIEVAAVVTVVAPLLGYLGRRWGSRSEAPQSGIPATPDE